MEVFKSAKNLHSNWEYATFWTLNVISLTMIVISIAATVYIFHKSGYQWVKFMYLLCVLQNFVTLYFSFAGYYEQSRYHETQTELVAWIITSAVFLFDFFSIIIYWLFGFKYWIISIEVPKFLNGELPTNSETKY